METLSYKCSSELNSTGTALNNKLLPTKMDVKRAQEKMWCFQLRLAGRGEDGHWWQLTNREGKWDWGWMSRKPGEKRGRRLNLCPAAHEEPVTAREHSRAPDRHTHGEQQPMLTGIRKKQEVFTAAISTPQMNSQLSDGVVTYSYLICICGVFSFCCHFSSWLCKAGLHPCTLQAAQFTPQFGVRFFSAGCE